MTTSKPTYCDVTVIGGGPAGSITAYCLAMAGYKTYLLEKQGESRDKTCGDALIPDSIALLKKLDLFDELAKKAHAIDTVHLHAPSNNTLSVQGEFFSYPRRLLDQYLREKAASKGVHLEYHTEAKDYQLTQDGVQVTAKHPNGEQTIHSKMLIVATGAGNLAAKKLNLDNKSSPSAVAIRGYLQTQEPILHPGLHFFMDKQKLPIYHWLFSIEPCKYNIGSITFYQKNKKSCNIQQVFHDFLDKNEKLKQILPSVYDLVDVSGAPLKCGLKNTKIFAERLLMTGEAIGTTYPLSGEGIGKAMETGHLAAKVTMNAIRNNNYSERFLSVYETMIQDNYARRYQSYLKAQRWLTKPGLLNYIVSKGLSSPYFKDKLQAVMNEEINPSDLFSLKNLWRYLFNH